MVCKLGDWKLKNSALKRGLGPACPHCNVTLIQTASESGFAISALVPNQYAPIAASIMGPRKHCFCSVAAAYALHWKAGAFLAACSHTHTHTHCGRCSPARKRGLPLPILQCGKVKTAAHAALSPIPKLSLYLNNGAAATVCTN